MEKEVIAKSFDLGTIHSWDKLAGGLVNVSYKVNASHGIFIVQQLNSIFPPEVTLRYKQLERFMRTQDIFVPVLLHTESGSPLLENSNAHYRAFEYVANDGVTHLNAETARSAGEMLGKFHNVMANAPHKPETLIPHFHDSQHYVAQLESATAQYPEKVHNVQPEIEACLAPRSDKIYDDTPITLHGDPKAENMLFKDGKAIALLDLDTLMQGSVLIDIGDAMRSWCHTPKNTFDKNIFNAALEGYTSHNSVGHTREDIVMATQHITLELATRFLTDYFQGTYFDWDPNKFDSRDAHNLARCKDNLEYLAHIK